MAPAGIGAISPLAGKLAPRQILVDLARLDREYFERKPDIGDPNQRVLFGTSGDRGSSLTGAFTEVHVAITQAICDYQRGQGIDGPLYMGKDTHALSEPAQRTALEVLVANSVDTIIQRDAGVMPTPVISRAILVYNRGRKRHVADGIVLTPSHNPPEDGGLEYNPPHGGPADTDVTAWIPRAAGTRRCRPRNSRPYKSVSGVPPAPRPRWRRCCCAWRGSRWPCSRSRRSRTCSTSVTRPG